VAGALLGFGGDKVPALAADLAFLFEAARDLARAAPFCLAASRHAARLFAYPEAAALARKGLRAAEALPESPERSQLELALSLTLGISLMATQGYATPEVERVHQRSRELCLRLGDERRLLPVLWGLYVVHLIGGRLDKALAVAEEMQAPARASKDANVQIQALHAMGVALGYLGRMAESQEYLKGALSHLGEASFQPAVYVLDPSTSSLCMLGRFQVVMGQLDQAVASVREAVARAQRLVHPQSVAYATFFSAWVHHDRGEEQAALELAEASMALAREHGLHQIREWARVARGSALCAQGRAREGVEELRRSLHAQQQMHALLERPYCLGLLARGLGLQGLHQEALGYVDEALALAAQTGERFYEAELHRLRGDLLLARALEDEATAERDGLVAGRPRADDPLIVEAEAAYETAVASARATGARTLGLRAACSRLRLRRRLGDAEAARQALVEELAGFTEGADAPHVAEARRLASGVEA
jgi:tetratricopeptide (TPR) repeat protein